MKKIKIVFDVDGVFLNFLQTISEFIETHHDIKSKVAFSPKQYDLDERFEQHIVDDFANLKQLFENDGWWKRLKAMPDIEKIDSILHNPLFDFHFLTSLPVHLHSDRLENLRSVLNLDIKDEQLTCVPLGVSKRDYLKELKCDYFIEDNLHNLADCYTAHHTSVWINLNENYYDLSHLDALPIQQFKSLNHVVDHIYTDLQNKIDKIIKRIESVLTDDLLSKDYLSLKDKDSHTTEGHCYIAAEALYHLLGGKVAGYVPQTATYVDEKQNRCTHWWLKDKDGNIIDPTAQQYLSRNQTPPYDLGKGAGFLTKKPSKRAQTIIKRMFDVELNKVDKISSSVNSNSNSNLSSKKSKHQL